MGGIGRRRDYFTGAFVLIAALEAAGCARTPRCPSGITYSTPPPACQPATPRLLVPKLESLAASETPFIEEPCSYCRLDAERCRRLAAQFAPKAARREIDLVIAADIAGDHRASHREFGAVERDLLACQAVGERNLAAAQALETFYALLEAEQDVLRTQPALGEIRAMEKFVSEARSRGIALASDTSMLARLKLDVSQRNAEAELLSRQLNDRLKLMLGWELADKSRICPISDATVSGTAVDAKEAVRIGLANRADLLQVRALARGLTSSTLPLARAMIAQADGTTAAMPPGLGEMKSSRDLHLRKEQLEHLLAEREQAATVEITVAAAAVETRAREAAVAQQRLDSWRKRLAELEQQQAAGRASTLDTGLVRLEIIGAERALFHEMIAYKTSQVKLAAAQGLLAGRGDEADAAEVVATPQRRAG